MPQPERRGLNRPIDFRETNNPGAGGGGGTAGRHPSTMEPVLLRVVMA